MSPASFARAFGPELPASWLAAIGGELAKPYFAALMEFLAAERDLHEIYPPSNSVFAAFEATPLDAVRAVLLGQDPYHDVGQAHGLSFSVPGGVRLPASLRNIFRELHDDLGCPISKHGCLLPWARQGIFLVNTVLTVRAHQPNSHRGRGWETFTDAVIAGLNNRSDPVIFVLWGKPAQKKSRLIDASKHVILQAPHPSPLSAHSGFFGSKPFSRINATLRHCGKPEIDWTIPDEVDVS